MAGHEAPHADIYDPVRLSPEGSLFDRIFLEKLWDNEHGDCRNPDNGELFNISDIQPQTELRNQLRQGVVGQEEYYPGQGNSLEHWKVIPDYPFQFLDEDNMRDYVNLLSQWIADGIHMPQDVNALWKSMNLLRLNCQYSQANAGLFRSVNGLETLIGALHKHFNWTGLRNIMSYHQSDDDVGMEEIVNLCREIVMLVEILGWSTDRPSLSVALCVIMRILYFVGRYKKDRGRILRFIDARVYDARLPFFDKYFDFIYYYLNDPIALSSELSLCADVTNRVLLADNGVHLRIIYALESAMGTLVSRFCDDDMNNMVNEDYADLSAALENVMKVMCQLCAKCGLQMDSYIVVGHIRKILRHALLPPGPGARLFKGRHLLFALLLSKYIFADPRVNSIEARVEDVKIVFDFAMSDLATRYLFNGRPRLKDLADEVVSAILTRHPSLAEIVLGRWPDLHS